MKTDLFQSCGHCWVFQICWHIECSTFIASCFKIWNSSAGIPPPPLALFLVMLPKTYLTSLSRASGSRWVITWLSLSRSLRSFLYRSSVYSCHLFLISSASIRSFPHSSVGKESTCKAKDSGSMPGSGRSAGEGIGYPLQYSWASLVAQLVKNLPAMQETWVGKIPWRRESLPTPVFWAEEFRGL